MRIRELYSLHSRSAAYARRLSVKRQKYTWWRATLILLCVPLSPGSTTWAQTAEPFASQEPIDGCGKAQAMARYFVHERVDEVSTVYREAMSQTDVLHYDLDIEVSNLNPSQNTCTISGTNTFTIQSKSPTLSEFTFRLRQQYAILNATIDGSIPVTVSSESVSTRLAQLDRTYGLDEIFTLTIEYTGVSNSVGMGSIEVQTQSGIPVVSTLSEPYYAYTWWPAKDGDVFQPGDNSDKATVDFSITVPDAYQVPSNGLLTSTDPLSGNRTRYNWSVTTPIVPYLLSFAATSYTTWTADYVHANGTMPVEFYVYPSLDTPGNRAGWERSIDMLHTFAPLFGEYPFIDEKYGIYNFPFGGGMEHQTMTGQCCFSERLTSHELAHQWWGDMITCKTWSDIWLNEGFATYGECLFDEFQSGTSDPAAYFTCMASERPSSVGDSVYVYPQDTDSVSRIFSSNYSYRKGAWVLHQLRHLVGDSDFFQILADYRAAYEYGAATTDDFAAVASSTHGTDLTWFFQQWVYDIGAPAYQYGWDTANVDGQEYLLVRIAQVQTAFYPDIFTMPVDLHATIDGANEILTVWNNQRTQWFAIPTNSAATDLDFDPDKWILWTAANQVAYVAGDLDEDLDVDAVDFTAFENCYTGEAGFLADGCQPADFDGDNDVDCADYGAFSSAWTAAGDPPELSFCVQGIPATSDWGLLTLGLLTLTGGTVILVRPRVHVR